MDTSTHNDYHDHSSEKPNKYIVIIILALSLAGIIYSFSLKPIGKDVISGKVLKVLSEKDTTQDFGKRNEIVKEQELLVEIMSGTEKKEINILNDYKPMSKGDKIFLRESLFGDNDWDMVNISRIWELVILFIFFIILVILTSGLKGFYSLVGLLFSFTVIFAFIVPQILNGASPVNIGIGGAALILIPTLYLSYGLKAMIKEKVVLAGNEKLLIDNKVEIGSAREILDRLASEGKTLSLIAIDNKLAGVVAAADTIKFNAKKAVLKLKELGIEVAMITGDHKGVAKAVGKELGIERIFAEVLPEDKAKYVKKLQEEGKFTAMVGDGVNDAPALAQSDVGIAIGAGTDVAIETAKVVLMKSDPLDILRAITLSKATVRKMKQNLFWASIYNVLAIPIAGGILYPSFGIMLRPEFAALLMSI